MRLAIINHHGRMASGAEHTLMLLVGSLPPDVEPYFYLFEDGPFTQSLKDRYEDVVVVPMSAKVARVTRSALPLDAVRDSVVLAIRLATHLRRRKIDVVLTNSMKAHVIGSLAAKLAGIRCINYIHDILEGNALRLVREISRFCSSSRIACSGGVVKSLRLRDSHVVHSPIEASRYQDLPTSAEARKALGLPLDDAPVIGLVGRIAPWKGQDRFIRLAAALRDRGINAHFAIVGGATFGCPDAYVPSLHELVERCDLADRVHFLPWQEDLRAAYAAIDVACNCSDNEPFGRTSVEALACGVPIVCYDDAGVCEVFSDGVGGRKVPAGDETRFAEAVCEMLADRATGATMRERAIESARALDVTAVEERFLEIIRPRSKADSPILQSRAAAALENVS